MPLQFLAAQQYDFFAGFEDQHAEEMFESAYPEIKTDYSILHNQFYHDERLRIYNYTAYQTDQLNQKVLTGDTMREVSMIYPFHLAMASFIRLTKTIE